MTSIVTLKIGEPQYSYIPVYNFTYIYIYILCIYCVYIHRYQYQYPCFPYVLLSNRCTTYTSCGPTRDTQLLGVYVSVFVNCFSCGETHIPIILSYFVQVYMCHVYVILCVCVYLYPHISSVFVSGMVVFCALSTCWWSYSLFWLHFWARPKDVTVKNVLDFRNTTGLSAEVVRRFLEQYVLFWHRASSYLEIFICCWFCCSIYSVIPYWVILYVIACYRHIFWLFLHMLTQVVAPISRREATATSAVCAVANLDDTVQMSDLMGGGPVRPQSFSSNVNPGFC